MLPYILTADILVRVKLIDVSEHHATIHPHSRYLGQSKVNRRFRTPCYPTASQQISWSEQSESTFQNTMLPYILAADILIRVKWIDVSEHHATLHSHSRYLGQSKVNRRFRTPCYPTFSQQISWLHRQHQVYLKLRCISTGLHLAFWHYRNYRGCCGERGINRRGDKSLHFLPLINILRSMDISVSIVTRPRAAGLGITLLRYGHPVVSHN